MKQSIYQKVTDQVIEMMETAGTIVDMPWYRDAVDFAGPTNAAGGYRYTSINVLLLAIQQMNNRYSRPLWATFRQWKNMECSVNKGEKGQLIVWWRAKEYEDEESGETEKRWFAKSSTLFNADQVSGFTDEVIDGQSDQKDFTNAIEAAAALITQSGATVNHGGATAAYCSNDQIIMPDQSRFSNAEDYYSVLLHELVHWTGHKSRCARDFSGKFGSEAYAREELVAELGAAYLCSVLGVTQMPRDDHACYLNNWLKILKDDSQAIFKASKQAQQACDFLLGLNNGQV